MTPIVSAIVGGVIFTIIAIIIELNIFSVIVGGLVFTIIAIIIELNIEY